MGSQCSQQHMCHCTPLQGRSGCWDISRVRTYFGSTLAVAQWCSLQGGGAVHCQGLSQLMMMCSTALQVTYLCYILLVWQPGVHVFAQTTWPTDYKPGLITMQSTAAECNMKWCSSIWLKAQVLHSASNLRVGSTDATCQGICTDAWHVDVLIRDDAIKT